MTSHTVIDIRKRNKRREVWQAILWTIGLLPIAALIGVAIGM